MLKNEIIFAYIIFSPPSEGQHQLRTAKGQLPGQLGPLPVHVAGVHGSVRIAFLGLGFGYGSDSHALNMLLLTKALADIACPNIMRLSI